MARVKLPSANEIGQVRVCLVGGPKKTETNIEIHKSAVSGNRLFYNGDVWVWAGDYRNRTTPRYIRSEE